MLKTPYVENPYEQNPSNLILKCGKQILKKPEPKREYKENKYEKIPIKKENMRLINYS